MNSNFGSASTSHGWMDAALPDTAEATMIAQSLAPAGLHGRVPGRTWLSKPFQDL